MKFTPLILCAFGALAGCIGNAPKQIDANSFLAPPPPGGREEGALVHPNVQQGRVEMRPQNIEPIDRAPEKISDIVAEQIRPAGEAPAPAPQVAPATVPLGRSSGEYLTLGGVMCEVNSRPIFANKVVALAEPDLMSKARTMDEEQFKPYAANEIAKWLRILIRDELEFAAAQKELGADDKHFAEILTTQWRQQRITESGGSIEMARRKAQADGSSFEELVERQFSAYLRQIYYQKKLMPRIQIRADDMRDYYRLNKEKEFTERESARFRLIKITADATGNLPAAYDKIKGLRERALRGEDFEQLARSFNDDPRLMKQGGDVGWMDRHAYREEQIEEAVWKINVGELTDIIQIGNAYYLGKLEQRKNGRTRPFEEESVQDVIRAELRRRQFAVLQSGVEMTLRKQAVVAPDPPIYDSAMEMVFQKYPRWKAIPATVAPLH